MTDAILPMIKRVNKTVFRLSEVSFKSFSESDYKKNLPLYFADGYYFELRLNEPAHFVTIIGMNDIGFLGKDSWVGTGFILPFNQFHENGIVKVFDNATKKNTVWRGISHIYIFI